MTYPSPRDAFYVFMRQVCVGMLVGLIVVGLVGLGWECAKHVQVQEVHQ